MATKKRKTGTTGSKKYSETYKIQALLLLQHNDYNHQQTAKELGISFKTLMNWKQKFGAQVLKSGCLNPDEKIVIPSVRAETVGAVRKDMMVRETEFLNKVYNARKLALDRGLKLLENEEDLKKVTDFMRIAHEIYTGEHVKSIEERKQTTTYFTNIYQQFVKKEENETIEIKEHNNTGD